MDLPPAGAKYDKQNENESRNKIERAIEALEARVKALEEAPAVVVPDPDPNVGPTADFSFNRTGLVITCVDESTDTDGTIVGWLWDFGDGGTSNAQNPNHTYQTAGTYTLSLVVTDNEGAVSAPASQTVTIVLVSGLRTGIGAWRMTPSRWGTPPHPDAVWADATGRGYTKIGGWIDQAVAADAAIWAKFYSNNSDVWDGATTKEFVPALWKSKFDTWWASVSLDGGAAKFRAAVRDGHIRGVVGWDDYTTSGGGGNGFMTAVSFAQLEECCQHVKVTKGLSWLPIAGRGRNTSHKLRWQEKGGGSKFQYFDAGWFQIRPDQFTTAQIDIEIQAGIDCGLASVGGLNIRGGDGPGTDAAGWTYQELAIGFWGLSPTEIEEFGLYQLNDARICGLWTWSYSFEQAYMDQAPIVAAYQTLYNAAQGRTDGPINIFGTLTQA